MSELRHLKPLFFGRLLRIAAGLGCFVAIPFVPAFETAWLGILALVLGGVVFVAAGVLANPGCEITAPVNLFLPPERRICCFCPLFTPLDRLEHALRGESVEPSG